MNKYGKNEHGFTLVEMLCVLSITMLLVAAISKVGYAVYEEKKLDYIATYFEFKLRETQLYAIENEVVMLFNRPNMRTIEANIYYAHQNKLVKLWSETLPPYIDAFNIYKNGSKINSITISGLGQINGIYKVVFEHGDQEMTLYIGLGKGRITRN